MAQLGNLIKSLATKAGIKIDDETLKKILLLPDLSQMEVPDEFNQALEANLLTVDSAAANTAVRSRLIAEAMNGVDSELEKLLGDVGFDDNFQAEWKTIGKQTNEKIRRLTTAIKAKEAKLKADAEAGKKADPNTAAELNALKGQIVDLNKSMEQAKTTHLVELDNERNARLADRKDFTLTSILAGKNLPKNGLPADINILTAKTLIQAEAAKHGLIVGFDANNQPTLKQKKDGAEIDFFVDNKPVDYSQFIDGVLAQNKFLQINDPNPDKGGGGNNPQPQPQPGTPSNPTAAASIDAQLAQLGAQV